VSSCAEDVAPDAVEEDPVGEVVGTLAAERARVRAITDPGLRSRLVGELFAVLEDEIEELSRIRIEAVVELRRAGWSYQRIGLAAGLSKSRVAQLARQAGQGFANS
jgi:DNA-directed RNA polymerase specialized sigma24 family protein